MSNITILIDSKLDSGKQTFGDLHIIEDGKILFSCKTLELPWRNNERNISCIPEGMYPTFIYTRANGTEVLKLKHVNGRTSIEIHSGNYISDIKGCILVGDGYFDLNKDGLLDIVNSKITLEKIIELVRGKEIKVIVLRN